MARIKIKSSLTISDAFDNFILAKSMQGVSDVTLKTYKSHFRCISKHLDTSCKISELSKQELSKMIASMRGAELASNSIASFVRVLKAFLSWANEEGLTAVNVPRYKAEETVKETYSDEELSLLLLKPNLNKCTFAEYRTWVIINFLLNSGARASTIRSIQIRDLDLDNCVVVFRHNKSQKVQIIPLCSQMVSILKEYLHHRGGSESDYLFCTENDQMLTAQGLRWSVIRYNKSRGVEKTSIHLFRHTFAKKYLIDCGGDAFTLQRILGHATLDMTKHYCNIYNVDIAKNYDRYSPLQQMDPREKRITFKAD